ncbi:unnamed protein product [Calypogeia fissa]
MAARRLFSGMVGLMAATLVFGLLSMKAVSAGTTFSIRWAVPFNMEGLPLGGAAAQPIHQTTLNVSDSIRFEFDSMRDDLLEVSSPSFLECNSSDPIHYWANGNTTITFSTPGEFHYISGLPRHCLAGQFLLVTVVDSSTTIPPPKPSDSEGSEASTDQTAPDDVSQNIMMTGSKIEARHDESILNVHPTSVLTGAGAKAVEKDIEKKTSRDATTTTKPVTKTDAGGSGGNAGGHDQKKDGNIHPSPGMHGPTFTKREAHDSAPHGSGGGAGGNTNAGPSKPGLHPSPWKSGDGHSGGTTNKDHPSPGKASDHGHSNGAHPTPGKAGDHGQSNGAHPTPGQAGDHGHSTGAHPTPGKVDGHSKEVHPGPVVQKHSPGSDGHQVSEPKPGPQSKKQKFANGVGAGFEKTMQTADKVGNTGFSLCGSGVTFRCQQQDNGYNANGDQGGVGGGDFGGNNNFHDQGGGGGVGGGGFDNNFQAGGGNAGTNQPGQGTDPHAGNDHQGGVNTNPGANHGSTPTF